MNDITFNEIVDNRLRICKETLNAKAKEYAILGDRLHNFRVAARRKGTDMAKALDGMAEKHFVSIDDLVHYPQLRTKEIIDEKIKDAINYLLLLEAIFTEELT